MTGKLAAALAPVVVGLATLPACAPVARSTASAPGAAASSPDVVHVAPPTGEKEADRASILAALEQVQPGGTVQFAPGRYLIAVSGPGGARSQR